MGDSQAAELMSFCASEFQQFFSHLGNSIHTYRSTGKVPGSAFKSAGSGHAASGSAAAKSDKPKAKRRPTAFNMFVKEKMEELKTAGVTLDGDKNNNGMFTLAVSSWKALSDAEKAAYTSKFKVWHSWLVLASCQTQCTTRGSYEGSASALVVCIAFIAHQWLRITSVHLYLMASLLRNRFSSPNLAPMSFSALPQEAIFTSASISKANF